MAYPGGKGGAYQKIINHIPPHDIFISLFMGHGSIIRNIRPARLSIGVDLCGDAVAHVAGEIASSTVINGDRARLSTIARNDEGTCVVRADALKLLDRCTLPPNTFIYCDPPYVISSRKSKRHIYKHEMTDDQHVELLTMLKGLDCLVAVSGYWSDLYGELLHGWRYETFSAQTRSGKPATEYLWMNYPETVELHDYRYLGGDYRERERIKRRKKRWVKRLQSMEKLERQSIMWAIKEAGLI